MRDAEEQKYGNEPEPMDGFDSGNELEPEERLDSAESFVSGGDSFSGEEPESEDGLKSTESMEAMESILEPGGKLSRKLKSYEYREGQIDLMRVVHQAFHEDKILIAEAGTGVGKSMAYLLPAILWAIENDERVVISTATIALGQQIIQKDIPMALKALGKEMATMLVNGRGNYLCRKRLMETVDNPSLFHSGEDGQILEKLIGWSNSTGSGNRADLDFAIPNTLWNEVRAEHDNCAWSLCPMYNACFLKNARFRAREAQILVTNHHLLFADLAARMEGVDLDDPAVLPPYSRLVIDEAQHMENSATSLFSSTLSIPALNRLLNHIYRSQNSKNLLARTTPYLEEKHSGTEPENEMEMNIEAVRRATALWSSQARNFLGSQDQSLLNSQTPTERENSLLLPALDELRNAIDGVSGLLGSLLTKIVKEENDQEQEALIKEIHQARESLEKIIKVADNFLNRKDFPEYVFWLRKEFSSDGTGHVECHQTPLSMAPMMGEALWGSFPTVVSLSATLSFNGNFDHWKRQVGVETAAERCMEKSVPSPFDYPNKAFLGVAQDAPDPSDTERWEIFLVEAISSCIQISGGHALVLFTSYGTLDKTFNGVQEILGDEAPLLLKQQRGDKGRQLADFRDESSSVLFATSTFWEGVDIAGDSLRLVIITRLPFRQPGHPVDLARSEAMRGAGLNPFYHMTLPEAVKRFRQGFGRLIRSSTDRGAVMVLDSRVLSKPYGKLFLNDLPEVRRLIKPLESLMRDMEDFFYSP